MLLPNAWGTQVVSVQLNCTGTRQEAEQMERIVKPFLDSHLQALLLELLSVLQLLRYVQAALLHVLHNSRMFVLEASCVVPQ